MDSIRVLREATEVLVNRSYGIPHVHLKRFTKKQAEGHFANPGGLAQRVGFCNVDNTTWHPLQNAQGVRYFIGYDPAGDPCHPIYSTSSDGGSTSSSSSE